MNFRIADTFTDSLAKLTGDEQKAFKMPAFDLQLIPANPGMKFHRVDGARDKNFWSVRNNRDIRLMDEAQDIAVPELRFLAALGGDRARVKRDRQTEDCICKIPVLSCGVA